MVRYPCSIPQAATVLGCTRAYVHRLVTAMRLGTVVSPGSPARSGSIGLDKIDVELLCRRMGKDPNLARPADPFSVVQPIST